MSIVSGGRLMWSPLVLILLYAASDVLSLSAGQAVNASPAPQAAPSVTSLVMIARDEASEGATVEVEIRAMFPTAYLKLTKTPRMTTQWGFEGSNALSGAWAVASMPRPKDPPPDATLIARAQDEAARLMLLALGNADSVKRLRYSDVSPTLRRVTVGESAEIFCELDLDPKSRLPLRLRYRVTPTFVNSGEVGKEVEIVMDADDRRLVDGVAWPHHIRTSRPAGIVSDLRATSVRINPPLTPAAFVRPQ